MSRYENRRGTCRSIPHLLIPALLFGLAGCGGEDWKSDTHPARGRISINGEIPVGAVVELQSVGEQPDVRNSRPWAIVQEDGTYFLSTYQSGDGAPIGEYAVTLRWPPDVTQPSFADRLGGVYLSPAKSPWKFTIVEGENELPAIEITDAKVVSAAEAQAPRRGPPGPAMGGPPSAK